MEVHQKGWMHMGWFWRWVMVLLQPLQALWTTQGELALPLVAVDGAGGVWGAVGYAVETRACQVGKVIALVALRHFLLAEGWRGKRGQLGGCRPPQTWLHPPQRDSPICSPSSSKLSELLPITTSEELKHSSSAKEVTWGTCPTAHSQG